MILRHRIRLDLPVGSVAALRESARVSLDRVASGCTVARERAVAMPAPLHVGSAASVALPPAGRFACAGTVCPRLPMRRARTRRRPMATTM